MRNTADGNILEIIQAGIAAPSVDNCQPWFFSTENNIITIEMDHKRADFFGDANYAAAYITFGSVIENMAIASLHCGFDAKIKYFPEGITSNKIAQIQLLRDSKTSSSLYDSIYRRHTNRNPYREKPLPPETREAFSNLRVSFPGAQLFLIEAKEKIKKIAGLIKKVETIIYGHKQLHSDLFKWIRWSDHETIKTKDGLPIKALQISFPQEIGLKFISSWKRMHLLNTFGASNLAADYSYRLALKSAALGFITMEHNRPEDYIDGGRFFQRLWLTATSENLSLHPLGALIFFLSKFRLNGGEGFAPKQRQILRYVHDALCDLFPIKNDTGLIMLFRIGYAAAPPTARALRRPVSEVLIS